MKSFGKGTVYLIGSEFFFVLSNYLTHIGLARFLGVEIYGLFGVLMSLYLLNRAFLNTGLPRSVSKLISEEKYDIKDIYKTSIKIQLFFSILFALIYILFSSQIANLLKDSTLIPYLILLGIMVIPLAIYSLFLNGFVNGLRKFELQAKMKVLNSFFRILFTFVLIFLGFKLFGALLGFFIATIMSAIIVRYYLKLEKGKELKWNKILIFVIPLTFTALALTFIRNGNVLFIKSMLQDNFVAGLYTSAATLATAPYAIFSAVPRTIMPSISNAIAKENYDLMKKYITKSLRYTLILVLPLCVLVTVTAKETLTLFYSKVFAEASTILPILIFASLFLILFGVFGSILTGLGKPKTETTLMVLILILMISLNFILVPLFGVMGAAYSIFISTLLGCLISGGLVWNNTKVIMNLISFIKITLASILLYFISLKFLFTGIFVVLTYGIGFLIYFLILFALKEFKEEDFVFVRKIFKQT